MPDDSIGPMLTAAACARRAGVTVRALRLYEKHGLLHPWRDEKGWRFYGHHHIARLAAVVTLKSLGLTLTDIGTLLQGDPPLGPILRLRAAAWHDKLEAARQGLLRTQIALRLVDAGKTPSVDTLCELIGSLKMEMMPKPFMDAANAMFTPEEQASIMARKVALRDDPTHGATDWAELIADVKRLIRDAVEPTSPTAKAAAARWMELVQAFSGGDPAIEAKSAQFWQTALAGDPAGTQLPFGQAEWEFIRAAARA